MADSGRAAALLQDARRRVAAGELATAMDAARSAAEADPSLSEAFAIWGIAACETGRFAEALRPLKTAAVRAPRGSVGWANVNSQLARALSNVGFWAQAEAGAGEVEAIQPPDPPVRQRIGAVFSRIGLIERGLGHLEWAAQAEPDLAEAQLELGIAYLSLGRLPEAEAALQRAIALAPLWVQPHLALASLRRWTPETAHVDRLKALMRQPDIDAADRASLGFSLFKELDDLGRRDEAWPVLEAANAAAAALEPWSAEEDRDLVDALIETFAPRLFPPAPGAGGEGPTPIFVIGLPRSGTTLVERILASHSQVMGWGELPAFPILFRGASHAAERTDLSPAVVRGVVGADWRRVAEAYRAETAYLRRPGKRLAVDKLPANSLVAGALRLAFPEAPIVHVRRNPMDTLFSCHRIEFGGLYRWSSRLEDLADHYAQHLRLMTHWRECLGASLVEVDYDVLASDPEPQIRQLLAACGLEFEARCLTPDQAEGAVRTASIVQVREPISARGIGAWGRYAAQLEPLRARLAEQGLL
jgi:tetratricopeptide (TPR) repeat protein